MPGSSPPDAPRVPANRASSTRKNGLPPVRVRASRRGVRRPPAPSGGRGRPTSRRAGGASVAREPGRFEVHPAVAGQGYPEVGQCPAGAWPGAAGHDDGQPPSPGAAARHEVGVRARSVRVSAQCRSSTTSSTGPSRRAPAHRPRQRPPAHGERPARRCRRRRRRRPVAGPRVPPRRQPGPLWRRGRRRRHRPVRRAVRATATAAGHRRPASTDRPPRRRPAARALPTSSSTSLVLPMPGSPTSSARTASRRRPGRARRRAPPAPLPGPRSPTRGRRRVRGRGGTGTGSRRRRCGRPPPSALCRGRRQRLADVIRYNRTTSSGHRAQPGGQQLVLPSTPTRGRAAPVRGRCRAPRPGGRGLRRTPPGPRPAAPTESARRRAVPRALAQG